MNCLGGVNNEENTEGYIIGELKEIYHPEKVQLGRDFENEEDTSGIDYTLNEENLEKCDEYIFAGWYLDKDYKKELSYKLNDGEADITENKKYYVPEEGIYPNTVLYAKWYAPAAKIDYNFIENGQEYTYKYTGDYQEFTAQVSGKYKIEAWGAERRKFIRKWFKTC